MFCQRIRPWKAWASACIFTVVFAVSNTANGQTASEIGESYSGSIFGVLQNAFVGVRDLVEFEAELAAIRTGVPDSSGNFIGAIGDGVTPVFVQRHYRFAARLRALLVEVHQLSPTRKSNSRTT